MKKMPTIRFLAVLALTGFSLYSHSGTDNTEEIRFGFFPKKCWIAANIPKDVSFGLQALDLGEGGAAFFYVRKAVAYLSIFENEKERVLWQSKDEGFVTLGYPPILAETKLDCNDERDLIFIFPNDDGTCRYAECFERKMIIFWDGKLPGTQIELTEADWWFSPTEFQNPVEFVESNTTGDGPATKTEVEVFLLPCDKNPGQNLFVRTVSSRWGGPEKLEKQSQEKMEEYSIRLNGLEKKGVLKKQDSEVMLKKLESSWIKIK